MIQTRLFILLRRPFFVNLGSIKKKTSSKNMFGVIKHGDERIVLQPQTILGCANVDI